jgi:hypothetical protein
LLELTGRLLGKALWDGVLLDAALAPVFVHKLMGQHSYLEELPQLDAVLYNSLMQLKRHYSDAKVANREIRVWHGATENGP